MVVRRSFLAEVTLNLHFENIAFGYIFVMHMKTILKEQNTKIKTAKILLGREPVSLNRLTWIPYSYWSQSIDLNCKSTYWFLSRWSQGVLGLQVFAFCGVTINDEHTKLDSKERIRVKDGICTKLCLQLWFESDWSFCNVTDSGLF